MNNLLPIIILPLAKHILNTVLEKNYNITIKITSVNIIQKSIKLRFIFLRIMFVQFSIKNVRSMNSKGFLHQVNVIQNHQSSSNVEGMRGSFFGFGSNIYRIMVVILLFNMCRQVGMMNLFLVMYVFYNLNFKITNLPITFLHVTTALSSS